MPTAAAVGEVPLLGSPPESGFWQLLGHGQADASQAGDGKAQDTKVVVGNKKIMGEEGVSISQAVDDYMREMEVRLGDL